MDSCLAAWMKPQVLTSTTSASSPSSRSVQPPADRRAASSSESTSLRAQPRVTRLTVRELDTPRGYAIRHGVADGEGEPTTVTWPPDASVIATGVLLAGLMLTVTTCTELGVSG